MWLLSSCSSLSRPFRDGIDRYGAAIPATGGHLIYGSALGFWSRAQVSAFAAVSIRQAGDRGNDPAAVSFPNSASS
jgi:hypothetical protein